MRRLYASRLLSAFPQGFLWIVVFTVTLVTPHGGAGAQFPNVSMLRAGASVRVATVHADSAIGTRRAIGIVQTLSADSMTVTWDNGLRSSIAVAQIWLLEVSEGQRSYVARGLGIGLLGGALVGAGVGAARYEKEAFLDFGIGLEMLGNAIVFGLAGTVTGGVVGASVRGDRWWQVMPDRQSRRVSVAPFVGARAQGIRFALHF